MVNGKRSTECLIFAIGVHGWKRVGIDLLDEFLIINWQIFGPDVRTKVCLYTEWLVKHVYDHLLNILPKVIMEKHINKTRKLNFHNSAKQPQYLHTT